MPGVEVASVAGGSGSGPAVPTTRSLRPKPRSPERRPGAPRSSPALGRRKRASSSQTAAWAFHARTPPDWRHRAARRWRGRCWALRRGDRLLRWALGGGRPRGSSCPCSRTKCIYQGDGEGTQVALGACGAQRGRSPGLSRLGGRACAQRAARSAGGGGSPRAWSCRARGQLVRSSGWMNEAPWGLDANAGAAGSRRDTEREGLTAPCSLRSPPQSPRPPAE